MKFLTYCFLGYLNLKNFVLDLQPFFYQLWWVRKLSNGEKCGNVYGIYATLLWSEGRQVFPSRKAEKQGPGADKLLLLPWSWVLFGQPLWYFQRNCRGGNHKWMFSIFESVSLIILEAISTIHYFLHSQFICAITIIRKYSPQKCQWVTPSTRGSTSPLWKGSWVSRTCGEVERGKTY